VTGASKSRRALIDAGARQLAEGPHPERARRDAEELLLHLLRKEARERNRAWLFANLLSAISDARGAEFLALVARRAAGEPIQYITGEAEFYRMPFRVTPDVLIPRPETELVVERAAQLVPVFLSRSERFFEFRKVSPHTWSGPTATAGAEDTESGGRTAPRTPRILDVGTGSGAIAVSIAHDWPEAAITATDVSAAVLDVARGNAERLGFADRVRFLQGDLLDPVAGERFEIVVSNPPYVPTADRDSLSVEVREHEPALALFAGEDGLAVYGRLVPAAFAALEVGGFLVLEIGYGQSEAVGAMLADAGFAHIEFVPDLQGILRVACGRRP
jgi:release factor glutamine methyltransferase